MRVRVRVRSSACIACMHAAWLGLGLGARVRARVRARVKARVRARVRVRVRVRVRHLPARSLGGDRRGRR